MSEQPKSLKRFALLAIGLVILLLGVANMGELTGQAIGGEGDVPVGGCGGEYDATLQNDVAIQGTGAGAKSYGLENMPSAEAVAEAAPSPEPELRECDEVCDAGLCPSCDIFDSSAPCDSGGNVDPRTSCDSWDNLKDDLWAECESGCTEFGRYCHEDLTGGEIACSAEPEGSAEPTCNDTRPIGRWVCKDDGPIDDETVCIEDSECPTLHTCHGDDLGIYHPSCVESACASDRKETINCDYGCKYREEVGRASCCTSSDSCLGDPDSCNHNMVCDPGETFANCASDCPVCNNNGVCDEGENTENCFWDCEAEADCVTDSECEGQFGERREYCDENGDLVWNHPWCRAAGTPNSRCLQGRSSGPCPGGKVCVETEDSASCTSPPRGSGALHSSLENSKADGVDESGADAEKDSRHISGGGSNATPSNPKRK